MFKRVLAGLIVFNFALSASAADEVSTEPSRVRVFERSADRVATGTVRMRDRDGGIVIPLAKGEALGDEENTLAAVRRLGFRTGKFELIGEQTQEDSERHPQDRCIGVVVTADIMRFSQLNASLQVKAVSALWDNLSRALAERQSNTTVAFSPLSDGIQVAFRTEPGESGLRAALDTIDTTHLWMLRGANAPDVRYGVACGDFSVVAPPSLLPVTVVGAVANLSRKLAYRSGPGIVAFSKPACARAVSSRPGRRYPQALSHRPASCWRRACRARFLRESGWNATLRGRP